MGKKYKLYGSWGLQKKIGVFSTQKVITRSIFVVDKKLLWYNSQIGFTDILPPSLRFCTPDLFFRYKPTQNGTGLNSNRNGS